LNYADFGAKSSLTYKKIGWEKYRFQITFGRMLLSLQPSIKKWLMESKEGILVTPEGYVAGWQELEG